MNKEVLKDFMSVQARESDNKKVKDIITSIKDDNKEYTEKDFPMKLNFSVSYPQTFYDEDFYLIRINNDFYLYPKLSAEVNFSDWKKENKINSDMDFSDIDNENFIIMKKNTFKSTNDFNACFLYSLWFFCIFSATLAVPAYLSSNVGCIVYLISCAISVFIVLHIGKFKKRRKMFWLSFMKKLNLSVSENDDIEFYMQEKGDEFSA